MASDRDTSWAQSHRRPLEIDRFINQFLDAACDESRRAILELLIRPRGKTLLRVMNCVRGDCSAAGTGAIYNFGASASFAELHLVSARKEGTVIYYRLRNHTWFRLSMSCYKPWKLTITPSALLRVITSYGRISSRFFCNFLTPLCILSHPFLPGLFPPL